MYPKIARVRQLMESGAIGRPVFAEATSHDWFYPANGFREWLIDPNLAGAGPLFDIASHRIDLMNYLFGAPARVSGHRSTLVHPIAVEDNATVLIEYESGVRGLIDVRWHSRVPRDEFRVRGTQGELDLTPLNGPSLVHPGGTEHIPAPANLHYPCVEDFVTSVLEGAAPRSSGATALAAEWVMHEALGFDPTRASVCLGQMSTKDPAPDRIALLQGTLDLLILRTLVFGQQHGQGIARAIQQTSDDVLLVDHGSLYPALQRLETAGWIEAKWGVSENNRKARFYALTKRGRAHLHREADQWRRLVAAMGRVLGPETAGG